VITICDVHDVIALKVWFKRVIIVFETRTCRVRRVHVPAEADQSEKRMPIGILDFAEGWVISCKVFSTSWEAKPGMTLAMNWRKPTRKASPLPASNFNNAKRQIRAGNNARKK
jgi:hypothetical protein